MDYSKSWLLGGVRALAVISAILGLVIAGLVSNNEIASGLSPWSFFLLGLLSAFSLEVLRWFMVVLAGIHLALEASTLAAVQGTSAAPGASLRKVFRDGEWHVLMDDGSLGRVCDPPNDAERAAWGLR